MILPLADLLDLMSPEISIVADNAKTHEPKREHDYPIRRAVKRCISMPQDLSNSTRQRRRRRARRVSDSGCRWSAEPLSPTRSSQKLVDDDDSTSVVSCTATTAACASTNNVIAPNASCNNNAPPTTSVLRKPVRQASRRGLEENRGPAIIKPNSPPASMDRQALMPIKPERQQSLREVTSTVVVKSPKMDTVQLITKALEQLDSISDDDYDHHHIFMEKEKSDPVFHHYGLPTVSL